MADKNENMNLPNEEQEKKIPQQEFFSMIRNFD